MCTYTHGSVNFGSVRFFPSSDKFAYGIEQDSMKILNVSNCAVLKTFPTGHAKVQGINFNQDGSKMVTCGDDQKFKIWDSTTLLTTPTIIGGNFNVGQKIWSCEFSYDEYVLLGCENNFVKIYPPSFTNSIYFSRQHDLSGVATNIKYYSCDKNKYIMGSDNGRCYAWNSTAPFLTTSSHIRLASVDPSNSFLVFGN